MTDGTSESDLTNDDGEDKFSTATVRKLRERAAFTCSNPACKRVTVQPSPETEDTTIITGEAAHIKGRRPGTARYDPLQSSDDRRSISNGIWLCSACADMIDKDPPNAERLFPVSLLQTWKSDHEEDVRFRAKGIATGRGVVTAVEIDNISNLQGQCRLELGQNTLVLNSAATGDHLISDAIAAFFNPAYASELASKVRKGVATVTVQFFKNESVRLQMTCQRNEGFHFSLGDALQPVVVSPYFVVYLRDRFRSPDQEAAGGEVETLAAYFKLNVDQFGQVLGAINKIKRFFINEISVNGTDIMVRIHAKSGMFSFGALSSGEQQRVLLEIAFSLARYYSVLMPTILLLDQKAFPIVDSAGIDHLLHIMDAEPLRFQVVVQFFAFGGTFDPPKRFAKYQYDTADATATLRKIDVIEILMPKKRAEANSGVVNKLAHPMM